MKEATVVEGRCYYAQSNPKHPYVWAVYNNVGSYIESFGGSIHAAKERLKMLDFDELIRRRSSAPAEGAKKTKDRHFQASGIAAAAERIKNRIL